MHILASRYEKGLSGLKTQYRRITEEEAKRHWLFWFGYYETHCSHGLNCKRRARGEFCEYGMRFSDMHMITGAVLPIWHVLDRHFMRR